MSSANSKACDWSNWLFDLSTDPFEEHNLWDEESHRAVKQRMIERIQELLDGDKLTPPPSSPPPTTTDYLSSAAGCCYAWGRRSRRQRHRDTGGEGGLEEEFW